jgi:hypothetical protein
MWRSQTSAVGLASLISSVTPAIAEPGTSAYTFDVGEAGGFWIKTGKEFKTPEGKGLVSAAISVACAAAGGDCTVQAATAVEAIAATIRVTGGGEEHKLFIDSPKDFQICKVWIDWNNMELDSESTFAAAIVRHDDANGLGIYAVIPKNRKEPHSAIVPMQFLWYRANESIAPYKCFPEGKDSDPEFHQSLMINCKGKNNCRDLYAPAIVR